MVRISILIAAMLVALGGCGGSAPATLLSQGKELFQTGRYQEAIASCSEAIQQNPDEHRAYNYRGRAYHCLGRLDQAVDDFSQAIRIAPKDSEAYFLRAIAYKEKGEKRLAIADEIAGRRLDPTYEHAYLIRPDANKHARLNVRELPGSQGIREKDESTALDRPSAELNRKATSPDKAATGDPLGTRRSRHAERLEADHTEPALVKDAYGLPVEPDPRSQTEQLLGIAIPHSSELPAGTGPTSGASRIAPRSKFNGENQQEVDALGRPRLSDVDPPGPLAPESRGGQRPDGRGARNNAASPRSASVPNAVGPQGADVGGGYSNPYGAPNPYAANTNPYAPRSPYSPNTNPYAPRNPYAPNTNPYAPRNPYFSRNASGLDSPNSARPRYPTGTPTEPYLPPVRPQPGTRDDFGY